MKSKSKFQRYGKYQRKMYLMNLMLALILMSILVTIIFQLNFKISANDYQVVMDEVVEKTLGNVSLKGEIITEALHTIDKSELLTRFLFSSNRGEYYLYSYLLKEELTKISSRYLNANFVLSIAVPDENTSVINPFGTMYKKDFSSQFFGEEKEIVWQMQQLRNQGVGANNSFIKGENIHYIRYNKIDGKEYYIFLQLPITEIIEFERPVHWYLSDGQKIFIKSGDWTDEEFKNIFRQDINQFEYNNERVFTYYNKEMPWELIVSYNKKRLEFKTLFFYFLLPFLSLSIIISWISYLITRSLYQPIKELVMETKKFIPAENDKDEFQLLKQSTVQVYELSKDLQEIREEKEKLLINKQNRDLLFGIITKDMEKGSEDKLYCVAVFTLHNISNEEERYILKQYLQNILDCYNDARYINTEDTSCALILETTSLDRAKTFINQCLENSPIEPIQIALSDPVFGLEGIKTAYLQCNLLLEYKYLYRQQRYLTADLIKVKENENYTYSLISENNLIQMVLMGQMESLKIYDQIIAQNTQVVLDSPQIRHRFVMMLIATLHRILREFHMDIPFRYNLTNLEKQWQDAEVFIKIRENLEDILNYVTSKEKKENANLAHVMLEYIEEHYQEDIRLVDLAEKINASEKYCSILFKQAVGENFKSYLNNRRIEKAKEILQTNPKLKIRVVAEQVGFNSANTFIRVFSKQMGITPKVYAELNSNFKN